jgi:hypothetical protein
MHPIPQSDSRPSSAQSRTLSTLSTPFILPAFPLEVDQECGIRTPDSDLAYMLLADGPCFGQVTGYVPGLVMRIPIWKTRAYFGTPTVTSSYCYIF